MKDKVKVWFCIGIALIGIVVHISLSKVAGTIIIVGGIVGEYFYLFRYLDKE